MGVPSSGEVRRNQESRKRRNHVQFLIFWALIAYRCSTKCLSMGNSNNKLEKKFSSLPPQYFPAITHRNQQSSIFRKLSRAAKRRSHDLGFLEKSMERNDSHGPLVDALFEPEYPIISSVTEADFTVSEVIAKGAFGNVVRVQRGADKITYAMKVMKKSQVIVDGAVQQCKDEATIQNAVGHHPFIVKPYFYFQNKENVYIVMEYIPRGELFTAWTACDCFGETLVRLYITEIAMVLDFLHRSGIIYRDLKMENILIDAQGHIQVIDFGLAKWLKKGHRTRTVCGTLQYIAPEVLNMQPYSHSADWWTLGVLMYALLVGEYPVLGANNHFEMAEKVNSHAYELPAEFSYSNECRQAVRNLCKKDPRDRIHTIQTLHKEPFFHCLNFDAVIQKQVWPNLEEELQAVFEGYTFSNGNISRSTSLADNLDHSSTSRARMQRDWSVVWNESVASLDASFV